MKNILILGNGAREKVIREKMDEDNSITTYISSSTDFAEIAEICKQCNMDLVIPSTEAYLCNGIADYLTERCPSLKVFGPTKEQARIEGSKHFSKKLMQDLRIPTPDFRYFANPGEFVMDDLDCKSYEKIVIKYSGLAQGKGVFLPRNGDTENVEEVMRKLFENGDDGVLIEERLTGTEISVLAFCNGKEACLMPQAQDYKRMYDGDLGPNTGGMGAICPSRIYINTTKKIKEHMDAVVKKLNYKGILYAGLMIADKGGAPWQERMVEGGCSCHRCRN